MNDHGSVNDDTDDTDQQTHMIRVSNNDHWDNQRKRIGGVPAINATYDDHGQVNNGVDQQTTIINNMSESGLLIQIHPSSTKDNKKGKKKELENSTKLIYERQVTSSCINEGNENSGDQQKI